MRIVLSCRKLVSMVGGLSIMFIVVGRVATAIR